MDSGNEMISTSATHTDLARTKEQTGVCAEALSQSASSSRVIRLRLLNHLANRSLIPKHRHREARWCWLCWGARKFWNFPGALNISWALKTKSPRLSRFWVKFITPDSYKIPQVKYWKDFQGHGRQPSTLRTWIWLVQCLRGGSTFNFSEHLPRGVPLNEML